MMQEEDQAFWQRLLEAFQVEAREHIQSFASGLLELETHPSPERQVQIVETIYRDAHSLKGAARAVDSRQIEAICQGLESVFSAWKKGAISLEPAQFDVLHRAVNFVSSVLESGYAAPGSTVSEMVQQLERLRSGKPAPAPAPEAPTAAAAPVEPERAAESAPDQPSPAPEVEVKVIEHARTEPSNLPPAVTSPAPVFMELPPAPETVRISTEKLDAVLLQAEEMLSAKLTAAVHVAELRELRAEVARLRSDWRRLEPPLRTYGNGGRTAEERLAAVAHVCESAGIRLKAVETRLLGLLRHADRDHRALGGMVENLLDEAKRLVMLPIGSLLEGFPRLVRELARDQGKEIHFTMRGHDIEIDKRILEQIKDPLIHILRNAVDHGIEAPAARGAKSSQGSIDLVVSQVGREVRIDISDDGRGLDLAKVKKSAVRAGKITVQQARWLNDDESRELIFRSDVSTTRVVTEISGRGLGLAIARDKVKKLGGRITVTSEVEEGTQFHIAVPTTLATIRAVLVRSGGQAFVLPVTDIDRVAAIGVQEIRPVEGRETITIDQRVIPLFRLGDVLGLQQTAENHPSKTGVDGPRATKRLPTVILGSAEQRMAFLVDEVGAEQEVLVKPLGKPLLRVRNVAGATILADGRPAPLLHTGDLLASAQRRSQAGPPPAIAAEMRPEKAAILVAEDSITSRMLLKNILEAAGYPVVTAFDGADALATLRTREFGLVVSDIDMPRLDGFGLTEAIRADRRLSELPVILVTARETPEDRERGIDAGANAYLIKSGFDQSDLLAAIGRLI